MLKSRSKIALFSSERHFEIWFPKKKTITFFWSKLCKLHKKDPILHVTTTFSLKQGETRTSSGPIPHPLKLEDMFSNFNLLPSYFNQASDSETSLMPLFSSFTCFRPSGAAQQQLGFLKFTSGSVWKWRKIQEAQLNDLLCTARLLMRLDMPLCGNNAREGSMWCTTWA